MTWKWQTFKLSLHVLKIPVSCFLLWNEIFPNNSKQINFSFLSLTESDFLPVMDNFSRNRLISIKKVGKNFSAILNLNVELHCETHCNKNIYWMLGIEECELCLSCSLKVKNCYSSNKHHQKSFFDIMT